MESFILFKNGPGKDLRNKLVKAYCDGKISEAYVDYILERVFTLTRGISGSIYGGFTWSTTKEGHMFWQNVNAALEGLRDFPEINIKEPEKILILEVL